MKVVLGITPSQITLADSMCLTGIGKAIAIQLIDLGAKVFVSYGSDEASAEAFTKDVGAHNVTAIKADSGSLEENERLIKATVDRYRKLIF